MPLTGILKKASHFIRRTHNESLQLPSYTEGEVVFCKNNVCVHPPLLLRRDADIIHHPGYLTITCGLALDRKPTLYLTWIPNTTLRKHPGTIEQRCETPTRSNDKARRYSTDSICTPESQRKSSSDSYGTQCSSCYPETTLTPETNGCKLLYSEHSGKSSPDESYERRPITPEDFKILNLNDTRDDFSFFEPNSDIDLTSTSTISHTSSTYHLVHSEALSQDTISSNENVPNLSSPSIVIDSSQLLDNPNTISECKLVDTGSLKINIELDKIEVECKDNEIKVNGIFEKEEQKFNETVQKMLTQSLIETNHSRRLSLPGNEDVVAPSWMLSPELLALRHNLTFPESSTASPVMRQAQHCCRKFSVELSEMRSLRLFFNDTANTKGQLVVASRQCQYKILHFHHGGLEKLAELLQQWNLLSRTSSNDLPYRHFMVCRPEVSEHDFHPEEGSVNEVTEEDWKEMLNSVGQLEDDLPLRKGIFLGGLAAGLRKIVWPFLLHCYSFQSTQEERDHISKIRRHEYQQLTSRRHSLEGAAKERFQRKVQCVIEEDVIRTDRSNPYYAGEHNPHVDIMKNILLNYAIYNSSLGYTQGMSDFLAPVLVEIEDEAESFWCFVGLMQRGMFVCTPTDSDMERNLSYLRELIREMVPDFYKHLHKHTDATELLFCHRWILLCFKREFPEGMALRIWEACWSNYLTDYFHLFVCLAIVSAYADDVIAQDLRTDEMLLHFSSLAMYMDGDLILRKARGLLYKFRERPVIPCTLAGLCQLCGPGMWDSAHAPTVTCRGAGLCPLDPCPFRGMKLP
uniref:Rab-GAP TBC domain-containing protein n=2 Tax=Clastoptera arizonana TaxID=38151 RepID=A0A1B6D4D2_9HEMI